jgi:enterochelin esterase-like enzyme
MPQADRRSLRTRLGKLGYWRPLVVVSALAVLTIGVLGSFSYWEAYYQHRGFVAPARLRRAGAGRLLSVNFHSAALGRSADYLVYLPSGYNPSRRYPVLYLLHGSPGRPQVFVDIANLDVRFDDRLSQHQVPPMIMVFPDGRIGGSTMSDSEWANTQAGQYENYVVDVVRDVDQRFATIPNRHARLIGGFSAGGYGAMNIALHHLGVFGSVEVWSGYFKQTRSGVFAHATRAQLAYDSPIDYVHRVARRLASLPFRVFMFVGRDDASAVQLRPMATALAASGAQVTYAFYPGGHDWQLWYDHLNQMLILAGQDVLRPLVSEHGAAHGIGTLRLHRRHRRSHPRRIAYHRRVGAHR